MIKAIFIDFFGVVFPDTLNEWVADRGITDKKSIHDIAVDADLGRIDTDEFFKRLGEVAGISGERAREEMAKFEAPRHHVVRLIERLSANHKLILVSNSVSGYLRGHLKNYDLERLYDGIVISAEFGDMKPNESIYKEALRLGGVSPEETVFFDDRPVNTEAASALGINSIVFESVDQMERDLEELGVVF